MSDAAQSSQTLVVHDLTVRIEEAQDALRAIRGGEVDALVVSVGEESQVLVLKGADHAHRVLFETLNEGAMTIAADTTILFANRRLAELLGRPLDKLLGAPLLELIAPADKGAFEGLLSQASSGGSKGEIALVTAGGSRVPAMVSISAVRCDADDTYTVVVADLTPLKQAQMALERANDELEARVEARTKELARANEALRAEVAERTRLEQELRCKAEDLVEADRRKDEFLSMLAHELRNPMASLFTATAMIRHVAPEHAAVERYRSVIERQIRNLSRLVDDLLDVSRITRRAITLSIQPVDLSEVVRSAVEASRPLIDARAHELCVSLPSEPVRLSADPTRFEQVLVNLLNNAAKYSEPGGRITLSAERSGREVVVRVRDTGIGIPADLLPRIFDLFVQGERSLDRSQGGLGIGLTLVKSLVEMHQGRVEAHCDGPGQGSELVLWMPVALDEDPRPLDGSDRAEAPRSPAGARGEGPRPGVPGDPALPRRRVLLVEDNADASATLIDLLEIWGCEVCPAHNGDEAIRLAATFQPQVVLMDIGLPGMDGYEVARRLQDAARARASAEHAGEAPLMIAISGYGQERYRSRGLSAGFDHYLVKPPDPEVLRGLLERGPGSPKAGG